MNTINIRISKTILTAIGLLTAGAISFAQADTSSYVLPKNSSPNFYLEVGAGFMRADLKEANVEPGDEGIPSDLKKFYGGTIAFGWRIAKQHKVQIESGLYGSSYSDSESGTGWSASYKTTIAAIPVLATYSYCIQLDPAERCELRLSPALGFYSMGVNIKQDENWNNGSGNSGYYNRDETASDIAPAIGAGVGFTWHFTSKFYLDAGYRLLYVGKTEYSYSDNDTLKFKAMTTHSLSVSLGWKF
ncbi:MAG: porin family protein [Opitutaceae bacterium]|jgi:opacity protein-like surface antigen|nr:porin family protein [Opitutaceae bacterium]